VTWYGYHTGATTGSVTTLIKTVKNGSDSFEYTYDSVSNITQIKKNGTVYESYTYDSLNQLKTVIRGSDVYEYTYDNGGNIQSVTLNGETIKSYGYTDTNWKDKLTSFNGQTITYDNIGNPLTYRDGYSFTWSNGRQLTGITQGTDNISYLYNADGLRASKTVNGTTTDYYWLEGVLLGQKTGNDYITYLYDENGAVYGIICNDTYYYYVFNAQGDVIGIIDQSGTQVVQYDYSAWGEVLAITGTMADTLGQQNPIRYRGYYYDNETGFYYLQSRYYDPVMQRFLNADGLISTGQGILGYNMFAYCGNNPVMMADHTGTIGILAILGIGALAVGMALLLSSSDADSVKPNDFREDETSQNCYGYAFNLPVYGSNPGDHSNGPKLYTNSNKCTTDEVAEYVIRDMKEFNKDVRIVSEPSQKQYNEYIVALKVQTQITIADITDFHFAVQLSNGKWADKFVTSKARYNKLDGSAIIWDFDGWQYDSNSVYFAVKIDE